MTGNVIRAVNINQPAWLGINISSGQQELSFPLDATEHFISPAARPTNAYVACGGDLYAFSLT